MNAQIFHDGHFVAEVIIIGMERKGCWQGVNGTRTWTMHAHGSWFRFLCPTAIDNGAAHHELFLETGEVITLARVSAEPLDEDFHCTGWT